MKDISACLSSNSIHWATPIELYSAFMDDNFIDVCPFHCEEDRLGIIYHNENIYINPPFNQLKVWCDYALTLVENGCFVFLLMPVRTDTKYFYKLYQSGYINMIYFFNHRLHFNESKSAPFPSMMIVLSKFDQGINIKCGSQKDFINSCL